MPSGIYKIFNKITEECYIGQSYNIEKRIKQHKSELTRNCHTYSTNNRKTILQLSWNKYGEENFIFSTVEECEIEKLNEREIYWIDFYNCNRNKSGIGYNLTSGGDGVKGYKCTDETKKKVSLANKDRVHLNNGEIMRFVKPNEVDDFIKKGFRYGELPRSKDAIEKYRKGSIGNKNVANRIHITNGEIGKRIYPSELEYYQEMGYVRGISKKHKKNILDNKTIKSGVDHWNYGKTTSKETREKMSKSHKGLASPLRGRSLTNEHKNKISKSLTGRKMSEESVKKSSESRKKAVIQCDKDGNFVRRFDSGIDAERETGILRSHISECCKGKRKTTGGYVWKYE